MLQLHKFIVAVSCFVCGMAFPGAWTHAPGKFYAESNVGYYSSGKVFSADGNKIPSVIQLIPGSLLGVSVPSQYYQYDATQYLEYGLPFDTDLILSVPYIFEAKQSFTNASLKASGFGDMTVGLKHKWLDLPKVGVAAVELSLGVPTGNEDNAETDTSNNLRLLPLGDGEMDLALRLHYSRAYSFPLFTSASVAYRFRDLNGGTPFKNDLLWTLESGYTVPIFKDKKYLNSVIIGFNVRGTQSLVTPKVETDPILLLSGNVVGQSQIDLQPGLFVHLWKNLNLVSSYSYTVWGENTGAGWSLRNGLAWAM